MTRTRDLGGGAERSNEGMLPEPVSAGLYGFARVSENPLTVVSVHIANPLGFFLHSGACFATLARHRSGLPANTCFPTAYGWCCAGSCGGLRRSMRCRSNVRVSLGAPILRRAMPCQGEAWWHRPGQVVPVVPGRVRGGLVRPGAALAARTCERGQECSGIMAL